MYIEPLQLIDETIERLEILSEFLAGEVNDRTDESPLLSPEARTCKEAMLTISVLVPKLQRARALQQSPAAAARRPECINCD